MIGIVFGQQTPAYAARTDQEAVVASCSTPSKEDRSGGDYPVLAVMERLPICSPSDLLHFPPPRRTVRSSRQSQRASGPRARRLTTKCNLTKPVVSQDHVRAVLEGQRDVCGCPQVAIAKKIFLLHYLTIFKVWDP